MLFHFVVNPVAGRRTSVPYVQQVTEHLEARGLRTRLYVTRFAGDAKDHVQALDDAVDRLVVVGGDGTLAEVLNGLRPLQVPVGVIPMGTANLVARETRMPRAEDAEATAKALAAAAPWRVDTMRVQGPEGEHVSVATVGVGLDGAIVHAVDDVRQLPGSGGYLRWLAPIADVVRRFPRPPLRIHVDERRTYAGVGCVIQNTRNYGGLFQLSPKARMDSGTLDVMVMKIRARRDILRMLAGGMLKRMHRYRDLCFVRGDRIRIESATRAPVQADGDAAGFTNLSVERLPATLDLLRAPVAT